MTATAALVSYRLGGPDGVSIEAGKWSWALESSLPLNGAASAMVADALRGRRAIMHHHDLPWQRASFAGCHLPPMTDTGLT